MQGAPGPRGEAPRTAAPCAGPRAPRARRTAGPDPRRPAAPPRASAPAPRNAPAAGPRTPAGPAPGSCCAARPAPRAAASSMRSQEATMRPDPTRSRPDGFAGYVSEHRFRLLLLLCALALAAMLATVYGTVGFSPVWARFDGLAA